MKTKLSIFLGLMTAISAVAQDYVTKAASGTTTASVYFDGRNTRPRLMSVDVTADNATNTLALATGTAAATAVVAAAATATNLVTGSCSLAGDDVVLLQNASGTVIQRTVYTNILSTNKTITLRAPLATNVAVGDIIRERKTNYHTLQASALANATTLYVNTTNGLAANDILIAMRGSLPILSNALTEAIQATNARVSLRSPAPYAAAAGVTCYERTNVYATLIAEIADDAVALHVDGTNGFSAADVVLIELSDGRLYVRTIDTDGVSTTNITITATAGVTLAAGNRVWLLNAQTYTTLHASDVGATSLLLDVSTGLAAGDLLVVDATVPWQMPISSTPAAETTYALTMVGAYGAALLPGTVIWGVSATPLAATFTSSKGDTSVIANVATGVAAGETLIIFANAGASPISAVASAAGTDYRLSTVSFTAALTGCAMSVGDKAYTLDTPTIYSVGNATVRRDGVLQQFAPNKPIRAQVTGAAACAINAITLVYP